MGCNCSKPNRPRPRPASNTAKTTQEFSLISPDGSSKTYGSRLEAEAAFVRSGRRGTVKPV